MPKQNSENAGLDRPILKKPRKAGYPPKMPKQPNGNWLFWVAMVFIFLIFMSQNETMTSLHLPKELSYSEFYAMLLSNKETSQIQHLELIESTENKLRGSLSDGTEFTLNIPKEDAELLNLIRTHVPNFRVVVPQLFWTQMFFSFMHIILIITFIWFLSHRGAQMGNKIWSFGKSRAKISKGKGQVTFQDVAGEAEVPFFSLSGSDFVEMFVGVGASRVRDLFDQGRKAAMTSGKGAIIFIDEIDAVGRLRFAGIGGGNDEREQTLNALLVEMDGFTNQGGLILIAATNRPDTLDPALMRPGRFDRQVVVGLPDINGREGILKVHSKDIKLAPETNLRKIAQQTVYFSGADLANVCNEAALLAARKDKESVGMEEFFAAVERVTMGPEKKSRAISRREKETTAYHEAGHALLSLLIEEVDTFTKVSIIPRGMAGGYTITPPTEDNHYLNKKELLGQMTVLLGGLIAEEIHAGDTSTGVSNDLERVSQIARHMVCVYGMSEALGTLSYGQRDHMHFLGRDILENKEYSDLTAQKIDEEVRRLVQQSHDRGKKLLVEHRDKLELMARRLIEKEVIDIDEARQLLGMPDAKIIPVTAEPAAQDIPKNLESV